MKTQQWFVVSEWRNFPSLYATAWRDEFLLDGKNRFQAAVTEKHCSLQRAASIFFLLRPTAVVPVLLHRMCCCVLQVALAKSDWDLERASSAVLAALEVTYPTHTILLPALTEQSARRDTYRQYGECVDN